MIDDAIVELTGDDIGVSVEAACTAVAWINRPTPEALIQSA